MDLFLVPSLPLLSRHYCHQEEKGLEIPEFSNIWSELPDVGSSFSDILRYYPNKNIWFLDRGHLRDLRLQVLWVTEPLPEKPSISVRSWLMVCSCSSLPPPMPAPRWRPTASISSMKTMQGGLLEEVPNPGSIDAHEELDELRGRAREEGIFWIISHRIKLETKGSGAGAGQGRRVSPDWFAQRPGLLWIWCASRGGEPGSGAGARQAKNEEAPASWEIGLETRAKGKEALASLESSPARRKGRRRRRGWREPARTPARETQIHFFCFFFIS